MAEVKPSTSRGEDAVELVEEASWRGADVSTSPESVLRSIAAESPSFLTWMWIQVLTACSGVWGARGGGLSGPGKLERASAAQPTQQDSESSEVLSRISASKSTWSEVPGRDIHHSVSVPRPSQLSVWEELKESGPGFFEDWGDRLELGALIAEGGQAQIFEGIVAGLRGNYVLKVFKLDAGFSLSDLKRHWPCSMREAEEDCSELTREKLMLRLERNSQFVFEDLYSNIDGERCIIVSASLLKDGRFAFLMHRYWGDLRRLIDLKVEENTHSWEFDLFLRPPFSYHESIDIMFKIARGMQGLHEEGVLHRDLKAANVLTGGLRIPVACHIADYECAMFVQGTGFWRAPEVLQELLKHEEDRNGKIWTRKVDVYSFGMTCYEILTGQIPFNGYSKSKWGDVIKGERPFLPNYVYPELRELVEACWHDEPSQRPSFDSILQMLHSLQILRYSWN